MRLTETGFDGAVPVDGYGPGFFRVGGALVRGPLLLAGQGPIDWKGPEDVAAIAALAGKVDVIFFGAGAEIAHVPPALRRAAEAMDVGIEPMASPAACRTYNVLLGEGRRVALAALPV
jgi:uncharacterized protein